MTAIARALFWLCVAVMCAAAFVWPLAVSADPAQPGFQVIAVAALLGFFAALVALLVCKVRHTSS